MTNDKKQKPQAPCVCCGEAVTTHRYAQVIPLVEAGEDEKGPHVVEIEGEGGAKVRLKVPAYDDPRRLAGKRFVCLEHPFDAEFHADIAGRLGLQPEAVYELRHRPARKLVQVPLKNFARLNPRGGAAVLAGGRHVELRGIAAEGLAEVDYGVLLKVRCFGRQAAEILEDWAAKLAEADGA